MEGVPQDTKELGTPLIKDQNCHVGYILLLLCKDKVILHY